MEPQPSPEWKVWSMMSGRGQTEGWEMLAMDMETIGDRGEYVLHFLPLSVVISGLYLPDPPPEPQVCSTTEYCNQVCKDIHIWYHILVMSLGTWVIVYILHYRKPYDSSTWMASFLDSPTGQRAHTLFGDGCTQKLQGYIHVLSWCLYMSCCLLSIAALPNIYLYTLQLPL